MTYNRGVEGADEKNDGDGYVNINSGNYGNIFVKLLFIYCINKCM